MIEITYFVHGTTIDNENGKSTGWLGGELSEKGINQSIELAKLVSKNEFDAIFCSDLKRAIQSAELNFPNKQILHDERLRECNYGDFNGKDEALVNYESHIRIPFPNGECLTDVESRVHDFLSYLKSNFDGKQVAIVAHRAPQLALEVILNGKSWEEALESDWRKTHTWQPGWNYILK